jgi:hypothetical protein
MIFYVNESKYRDIWTNSAEYRDMLACALINYTPSSIKY